MKCLITSIEESVAKNGKPFLKVAVKTQEKKDVTLFVWQNRDSFVELNAKSRIMDITANFDAQFPEVSNFVVADGDPSEFVENAFPSDDYANQLLTKILSFVSDPEYVALNNKLFAEGSEIREKFIRWPAAKSHHHNMKGGLLLHTYEVLQFVSMVANNETFGKNLDKQVLLEGALLHDIGKLKDYIFDGFNIEYSPGITLGSHLATGCEFIARYAENPDSARMEAVKHIIRSHHFLTDWGAVNTPATREAVIVFYGDYYSMYQVKTLSAEYDSNGVGRVGRDTFIDIEKACSEESKWGK